MSSRHRALAMAGLAVVVLAGGACGDDPTGSDEREARAGFYADSTWPYPYSDLWRSQAVQGAGLPKDLGPDELVAASVPLPAVPFFGVTYGDDVAFVLGGSPYLLEAFTAALSGGASEGRAAALASSPAETRTAELVDPYVAKVDVDTLSVELLELPRGSTVNYIGGLLVHENGMIYAVATSTLYEIDPVGFKITRSLPLPVIESNPFLSVYNGLQVAPTSGDIILKSSDFAGGAGGSFLAVDVADLTIHARTDTDVGTGRLTIAVQEGTEYVYLPGSTDTARYRISPSGFALDKAWSERYRTEGDGSTQATSILYMPKYASVAFADNNTIGLGVSAPMRFFTQSATSRPKTLTKQAATNTTRPGGSWYMVAGDPFRTGMVVVQDQVNWRLAGWQLVEQGSPAMVWETDRYKTSAGQIVASDQGQVYVDDRTCDPTGADCTLSVVVLDLATGLEVSRVQVAGTVPSLGHMFVTGNALFYIASEAGKPGGFLTRVSRRTD